MASDPYVNGGAPAGVDGAVVPQGAPVGPPDGQVDPQPPAEAPSPLQPVLDRVGDAILAACAQCLQGGAGAQSGSEAKDYANAALSFAQAAAQLAPPIKPIDPNLHADHRGIDAQRAMELLHESQQKEADRQHQVELKKLELAAQAKARPA